jgi:N-acetylmuramoyl-L-alanine amidase
MNYRWFVSAFVTFALALFIFFSAGCSAPDQSLQNRTIVLDPGHGGTTETDAFRAGPTGEREEWINLRVALKLEELLTERGAEVLMTRRDDVHVELADRAALANENRADLFISIHHNATADPDVNFPIIYFHGNASENRAGVRLALLSGIHIRDQLFGGEGPLVIASDHTIFPSAGTRVLRDTYGIPGIIVEASFFTNPDEEQRLKRTDHNRREARALLSAILAYFDEDMGVLPIEEKNSRVEVPPFRVLQEAERMSPEALGWEEDFLEAAELSNSSDPDDWETALELATRSARSFPDSPAARDAHQLRADLLGKLGRHQEAFIERLRVREFYVPVAEDIPSPAEGLQN